MKRITKAEINRLLPNLNWIKRNFLYYKQTGIVYDGQRFLERAVFYRPLYSTVQGHKPVWDSCFAGPNEAVPGIVYKQEYIGGNFRELIWDWMKGEETRRSVVQYLYDHLNQEGL